MKLLFENWRKYLNEDLLTEKLLLKDGPNGWQLYGQLIADAYEAAPEYDPAAAPALFIEVVGQASYYLYRGNFPEQKIAFLPGFDYFNLGKIEGYDIVNKELIKL